jgi:hypothetical protein
VPSIKPLNIWGRAANLADGARVSSLEAQRNDLWVLRLDSVLSYISEVSGEIVNSLAQQGVASALDSINAFGAVNASPAAPDTGLSMNAEAKFGAYYRQMPPTEEAVYYASSVEFPEQRVASQVIVQETRPYQMPASDEPLGPVRITFLHDVTNKGGYAGSSLDAVLRIWRALARTGRGETSGQDLAFPLGVYGTGLLPRYSFDLRVDLFKGSVDGKGMDYSAGYLLKSAWLQSIQVGALRYAGGTQNLEISTAIAVADITPVTSD